VLFHVVAITLMALPAPPGNLKQLSSGQGQAQLADWAATFRGAGLDVSDEAFEAWVRDAAGTWGAAHAAALDPLTPYYRLTGTRQSWRMFSVVSRRPTAVEIHVLKGDAWERVYATGEAGAQWRSRQLDQERVRAFQTGFLNLSRQGDYRNFVHRWVAPSLFEDDPEVSSVRVQLRRSRSLAPARVRGGDRASVKTRWAIVVPRSYP